MAIHLRRREFVFTLGGAAPRGRSRRTRSSQRGTADQAPTACAEACWAGMDNSAAAEIASAIAAADIQIGFCM